MVDNNRKKRTWLIGNQKIAMAAFRARRLKNIYKT
jgi:hypothetical protein